ncbi:MAG TPA: TetR/AcrR family transcriptional regulator [Gelria sp.]|jgi:AcrR family transcriptional regulator|nr:TetR/AcrR family transcriptional regulator [Gelria sp.]
MQKKKEKILECALDLFVEKGYVNTPVRDIIDRSGYGTGTFYRYFNNKEDLLKILLTDFLEQIIDSVNNYFKEEDDLCLRFIETKRVMLEVFIRNEKLAEIFSRAPGISDPIDECLNEFDNKFLEFTGKNIQFGIKKGIFRDLPVIPIASSTLAMIKYAVFKWVVNKDITEAEMIDMVISFHQSLAIGLVKNNSCRN